MLSLIVTDWRLYRLDMQVDPWVLGHTFGKGLIRSEGRTIYILEGKESGRWTSRSRRLVIDFETGILMLMD